MRRVRAGRPSPPRSGWAGRTPSGGCAQSATRARLQAHKSGAGTVASAACIALYTRVGPEPWMPKPFICRTWVRDARAAAAPVRRPAGSTPAESQRAPSISLVPSAACGSAPARAVGKGAGVGERQHVCNGLAHAAQQQHQVVPGPAAPSPHTHISSRGRTARAPPRDTCRPGPGRRPRTLRRSARCIAPAAHLRGPTAPARGRAGGRAAEGPSAPDSQWSRPRPACALHAWMLMVG